MNMHIPEEMEEKLQKIAKKEFRSCEQQVLFILTKWLSQQETSMVPTNTEWDNEYDL